MNGSVEPKLGTDLHLAIIMDGNGRWASAQGMNRIEGHRVGAQAVRRTVEEACRQSVSTLTLYAFSSDNWNRPKTEVTALMGLLYDYLIEEGPRCIKEGVRIRVIGRRDRLGLKLLGAIKATEAATRAGGRMELRIAIDYSARDMMLRAAQSMMKSGDSDTEWSRSAYAWKLGAAYGEDGPVRDVDLLIRSGGERRLSDFMLWECAYAEIWFTETMWPEFDEAALQEALIEFQRRERRYGQVPDSSVAL